MLTDTLVRRRYQFTRTSFFGRRRLIIAMHPTHHAQTFVAVGVTLNSTYGRGKFVRCTILCRRRAGGGATRRVTRRRFGLMMGGGLPFGRQRCHLRTHGTPCLFGSPDGAFAARTPRAGNYSLAAGSRRHRPDPDLSQWHHGAEGALPAGGTRWRRRARDGLAGAAWADAFPVRSPSPLLLVAGHGLVVFHDDQLQQTSNIPLGSTPLGILLAANIQLSGATTVTGLVRQPGADPAQPGADRDAR